MSERRHASVSRRWRGVAIRTTVVAVLLAGGAIDAEAQESPRSRAELSAGWVGFPDDGVVNETIVGGAWTWYVGPRVAIGPELALVQGTNHRHGLFAGRLTLDLGPRNQRTMTPFVVLAGGLFQTSYDHPGAVSTREGIVTVGGGVRARVSRRLDVGVEARAGWEAHVRVTGSVGVKLGTRGARR